MKTKLSEIFGHGFYDLKLLDGRRLVCWSATNAGRGSDAVTYLLIEAGHDRAERSAIQTGVLATTRGSNWLGYYNLTLSAVNQLGLTKQDIIDAYEAQKKYRGQNE